MILHNLPDEICSEISVLNKIGRFGVENVLFLFKITFVLNKKTCCFVQSSVFLNETECFKRRSVPLFSYKFISAFLACECCSWRGTL